MKKKISKISILQDLARCPCVCIVISSGCTLAHKDKNEGNFFQHEALVFFYYLTQCFSPLSKHPPGSNPYFAKIGTNTPASYPSFPVLGWGGVLAHHCVFDLMFLNLFTTFWYFLGKFHYVSNAPAKPFQNYPAPHSFR